MKIARASFYLIHWGNFIKFTNLQHILFEIKSAQQYKYIQKTVLKIKRNKVPWHFLINSNIENIARSTSWLFFSSRFPSYRPFVCFSRTSLLFGGGRLPHPGRRDQWLQRATVIAEIVWLTKMSLGFHYFQPPWGMTAQRVYATLSLFFLLFLFPLSILSRATPPILSFLSDYRAGCSLRTK